MFLVVLAGESGAHIKGTIFHDPIFHTNGLGVFQCLRLKSLLPLSFREASAKNMNTFTKTIPKSLPMVFTTAQQDKNKFHQFWGVNQRHNNQSHCNTCIAFYCMVSSANVKDNTTNSCKKHFREASTLKNVKIPSASFRDCSPVQIFDSYVQILHSEDENIKNRNSIGNTIWVFNSRSGMS